MGWVVKYGGISEKWALCNAVGNVQNGSIMGGVKDCVLAIYSGAIIKVGDMGVDGL